MSNYVLDACALLALLRNEPGADIVADALNAAVNGDAEIIMNKVNLLEVYYDLYRALGKDKQTRY
ncbi:MAG: PIN domain-containing protein [Oscillospiraceae bacterium]|nr:PIN domain-containing protein [Oscillospiraceae bacterium]